MEKMHKCVCSECGSENVEHEASVMWNKETGEYEVDHTYDKGAYCLDCERETSVDWIELTGQEMLDVGLWRAIRAGNLEEAETLLKDGADVEVRDRDGWSLLHYACFHNHVSIVRFLLEHGTDVNAKAMTSADMTVIDYLRVPAPHKTAREELLDLFRQYAPEAVMEAYCSPVPGPTR